MDNRYIALLILAIIFVAPMVVAQQPVPTTPTFEQSTDITLSVPCTLDGDVCAVSTACVATIINPLQTVLLNEEPMALTNAVVEVNLTSNQTDVLGQYEFSISCCDGPFCFAKALPFLITPSGAPPVSPGQGVVLITVFIILILLNGLLYFVGFRMETREESFIGRFLVFGFSIALSLGLLYFGLITLTETLALSPVLIESFVIMLFVFRIIFFLLLVVAIFLVFATVLRNYRIKRGLIDK